MLIHRMRPEDVGKEVVISIPVALVIQWDDKQVASFQDLQHLSTVVSARDGIAKGTVEPFENRGLHQEAPDTFGLTMQDLLHQVVRDVPVIAGESRYEPRNVLYALHGERGQLQPGDPAFGPRFKGDHISCREIQPHNLVEEGGRLVSRETQVGGP